MRGAMVPMGGAEGGVAGAPGWRRGASGPVGEATRHVSGRPGSVGGAPDTASDAARPLSGANGHTRSVVRTNDRRAGRTGGFRRTRAGSAESAGVNGGLRSLVRAAKVGSAVGQLTASI